MAAAKPFAPENNGIGHLEKKAGRGRHAKRVRRTQPSTRPTPPSNRFGHPLRHGIPGSKATGKPCQRLGGGPASLLTPDSKPA